MDMSQDRTQVLSLPSIDQEVEPLLLAKRTTSRKATEELLSYVYIWFGKNAMLILIRIKVNNSNSDFGKVVSLFCKFMLVCKRAAD